MTLLENSKKEYIRRPKEHQREADMLATQLMSKGIFLIDDLLVSFQKHFANRADVVVDRKWVAQVRYRIGKKHQAALRAETAIESLLSAKQAVVEGKVVATTPPVRPVHLFSKDELMQLTKAVVESRSLSSDAQLNLISKLTSANNP